MKERSVIFGTESVRAILAGKKTQTRRVMAIPPLKVVPNDIHNAVGRVIDRWLCFDEDTSARIEWLRPGVQEKPTPRRIRWAKQWQHQREISTGLPATAWSEKEAACLCPYGQPGDRLWVREAFRVKTWSTERYGEIEYRTDGAVRQVEGPWGFGEAYPHNTQPDAWRSPLFLPRWASRLTLEITEVRVQRLHEISEEDAIAEGAGERFADGSSLVEGFRATGADQPYRLAFSVLWDRVNAKRGFPWDSNPWVWCLSFRRVP